MVAVAVRKPIHFIGSSLRNLRRLLEEVRGAFGRYLLDAQYGETPRAAKPLKGFGGAGVVELIDDFDGNTYRAVYTIRFSSAVYVLHVFQKKARRDAQMPRRDIDLIHHRLERARQHHEHSHAAVKTLEDDHA